MSTESPPTPPATAERPPVEKLAEIDAVVAQGAGGLAIQLVREAQSKNPFASSIAVRLVEACLLDNQLMCAAHGTRSLLRHAADDDDEDDVCRYLGVTQAFSARVRPLRWCWVGGACGHLGNTSAFDPNKVPYPVGTLSMARDDGELWRGEHLVAQLMVMLDDENEWKGRGGARSLNHATMQHVQGNAEIAYDMYQRATGHHAADEMFAQHGSVAEMQARAYTNLAVLERDAPAARRHLDKALKLAPAAPEASERWLELARVTWQQGQLSTARHAIKQALKLAPDASHAAYAHALQAELHALRHEYPRAAASAARAASLQEASSPQLPACARWNQLLPRLPDLWGDARAIGQEWTPDKGADKKKGSASRKKSAKASAPYRELLIGCGGGHAKRTGGGWHAAALRWDSMPIVDLRAALADLEAGSVDEVHWCATVSAVGASGGEEMAVRGDDAVGDAATMPDAAGWSDVCRVLRPKGLLQVSSSRAPPESLQMAEGGQGVEDGADGTSEREGALFRVLTLGGVPDSADDVRVAVDAARAQAERDGEASAWTGEVGEHPDGALFQCVS